MRALRPLLFVFALSGVVAPACTGPQGTKPAGGDETGAPDAPAGPQDSDESSDDDTGSRDTDTESQETGEPCPDPNFGVVEGTVYEWIDTDSITPHSGAWVIGRQGDQSIQASSDADGHYILTLPVGTWTLLAQTPAEDCFSTEAPTLDITECGTLQQDLVMDVWAGG